MKLRLIYQTEGDELNIEHYDNPVDLEYRYFELSRERHNGPAAIKIPEQLVGVVPGAYYRLDADWQGEREQMQERRPLWATSAAGYEQPTEAQIRAVGRFVGSGRVIGQLTGITDRQWRYLVAGERTMSFTRWRVLMEFAGLVGPLPAADMVV